MFELGHAVGNQRVVKGHKPQGAETTNGLLRLATFSMVLVVCFLRPLSVLMNFALHSDLYSHIVLIPFVTLFLIWQKRDLASAVPGKPLRSLSLFPLLIAAALLAGYWIAGNAAVAFTADYLSFTISAFVCLFWAGALFFLNASTLCLLAFPLVFIVFMIPFPESVLHTIEGLLQTGSAAVAHVFFQMAGTPVFRQGMYFQLPGFSLEVASACCGIHSSLVLLITAVVASHLLLRSPWTRLSLVGFVIPLALIRNGFRIFTIGELCVHVNPNLAHSYIHTHGGPIFFLLSLIPFVGLLGLLIRAESRQRKNAKIAVVSHSRL